MGFPRILLICGLVYSAHAGIFKDAQKFGEDFIKVIKSFPGGGGEIRKSPTNNKLMLRPTSP